MQPNLIRSSQLETWKLGNGVRIKTEETAMSREYSE